MIKKIKISFIFGIVVGILMCSAYDLYTNRAEAIQGETIVSFNDNALPVINERLRVIEETLNSHDTRLTAGGL